MTAECDCTDADSPLVHLLCGQVPAAVVICACKIDMTHSAWLFAALSLLLKIFLKIYILSRLFEVKDTRVSSLYGTALACQVSILGIM